LTRLAIFGRRRLAPGSATGLATRHRKSRAWQSALSALRAAAGERFRFAHLHWLFGEIQASRLRRANSILLLRVSIPMLKGDTRSGHLAIIVNALSGGIGLMLSNSQELRCLLVNSLRKQGFCLLQFRSALRTQTLSGSVDEVCQHPHAGTWSFRRDFLRSQGARNCGGASGEQPWRRMRRIRPYSRYPPLRGFLGCASLHDDRFNG
jgi:hypothetical protein